MTDPKDQVVRVALAIKAALGEAMKAKPLLGDAASGDWYAEGGSIDLEAIARAAIAAMPSTKEAADIMADMFSSLVLPALDQPQPRRFLYVWEQRALEWLKAWRDTDTDTPINAWTSSYMRKGPPPWR